MSLRRLPSIVLAIAILFLPLHAVALSKAADGLQVSPLRTYPSQIPGQATNGSLTLSNNSEKPLVATMSTETFLVKNSSYDYVFDSKSANQWVYFYDSSVALAPHQSKVVNYSLQVPIGAAAGGYYFALIASVTPDTTVNKVVEIKRVASLVYLEVGGKLIKRTSLLNATVPWISFSRDIPIEVNLANTGNTHIFSRVGLTTSRWPAHQQPIQAQLENVLLPQTVRKVSSTVRTAYLPGIYKVHFEFAPAQGGLTQIDKSVLYLPPWSILAAVVVVIAVSSELGWRIGRKKKK